MSWWNFTKSNMTKEEFNKKLAAGKEYYPDALESLRRNQKGETTDYSVGDTFYYDDIPNRITRHVFKTLGLNPNLPNNRRTFMVGNKELSPLTKIYLDGERVKAVEIELKLEPFDINSLEILIKLETISFVYTIRAAERDSPYVSHTIQNVLNLLVDGYKYKMPDGDYMDVKFSHAVQMKGGGPPTKFYIDTASVDVYYGGRTTNFKRLGNLIEEMKKGGNYGFLAKIIFNEIVTKISYPKTLYLGEILFSNTKNNLKQKYPNLKEIYNNTEPKALQFSEIEHKYKAIKKVYDELNLITDPAERRKWKRNNRHRFDEVFRK